MSLPIESAIESAVKLVVVTGGPGAGKTAILELAKRNFCPHIEFIPEAASIIFSGGFPRRSSVTGRMAAQIAIVQVQRQLERIVTEQRVTAVALCDRGTLDGLAYWPGTEESFFAELGSTRPQYSPERWEITLDSFRGYDFAISGRFQCAADPI